jgi:hypothetical protein
LKITPILASDTTAAFLSFLVTMFWIGMAGGTLCGFVSLALYFFRLNSTPWKVSGITLGMFSNGAGTAGLLFLITADHAEPAAWGAVFVPIVLGTLAVFIWVRKIILETRSNTGTR